MAMRWLRNAARRLACNCCDAVRTAWWWASGVRLSEAVRLCSHFTETSSAQESASGAAKLFCQNQTQTYLQFALQQKASFLAAVLPQTETVFRAFDSVFAAEQLAVQHASCLASLRQAVVTKDQNGTAQWFAGKKLFCIGLGRCQQVQVFARCCLALPEEALFCCTQPVR